MNVGSEVTEPDVPQKAVIVIIYVFPNVKSITCVPSLVTVVPLPLLYTSWVPSFITIWTPFVGEVNSNVPLKDDVGVYE